MSNNYLSFNCANGCGACGVRLKDFETYRAESLDGKLIERRTVPKIVSTCCGADVDVWDERAQDITAKVEASPVQAQRGAVCEVQDGDPESPTHRQWFPARFVALDLVAGEPIVQREGNMPEFATWSSVRGLARSA